jgi:hypothetical protein
MVSEEGSSNVNENYEDNFSYIILTFRGNQVPPNLPYFSCIPSGFYYFGEKAELFSWGQGQGSGWPW